MNVVFVTSEIYPFSKTGGLADVSYSLPKFLKKEGVNVIVFTPFYSIIDKNKFQFEKVNEFKVFINNNWEKGEIFRCFIDGFYVYLINNQKFFNTNEIYEDYNKGLRFGFFCYGVLKGLKKIGFKPDIIHINDWQTAILPVLLKVNYKDETFFKNSKVILTIHNLAYQGYFPKNILYQLGLPDYLFTPQYLEFYNQVNFLKAGIIFSDFITTVSPTYAKEILEPIAGWGLDGVLRTKKDKLKGILNGIDENLWNPEIDKYIWYNYSSKTIELKAKNKGKLQEFLNFTQDEDVILFGFVGRLTYQKGFELIVNVLDELVKLNVQVIILGKGEKYYENLIIEKAEKYSDKISLNLKFSEELAHKIYAGIDFLLMPSVYEPCGLTQMISLKYGTVPIARRVGGLIDTINHKETGILFDELSLDDFSNAILKGIELFYLKKEKLRKMRITGMNLDFSWEKSCKEYIELYRNILGGS